jgi:hypothetical protein
MGNAEMCEQDLVRKETQALTDLKTTSQCCSNSPETKGEIKDPPAIVFDTHIRTKAKGFASMMYQK